MVSSGPMHPRGLALAFVLALPAFALSPSAPLSGPPPRRGLGLRALVARGAGERLDATSSSAPRSIVTACGRTSVRRAPIVTYTRITGRGLRRRRAGERRIWSARSAAPWTRSDSRSPARRSISLGSRSLLFLAQGEGAVVVTGMAQGHYRSSPTTKGPRGSLASPDAGAPRCPASGPTISARERLVGSTVDDAPWTPSSARGRASMARSRHYLAGARSGHRPRSSRSARRGRPARLLPDGELSGGHLEMMRPGAAGRLRHHPLLADRLRRLLAPGRRVQASLASRTAKASSRPLSRPG